MSLLGGFVQLADQLTKSFGLQAAVTYKRYTGTTGSDRAYADPVVRQAIVEKKVKQVRKFDGTMGVSTAQVTFLDPTTVSEFDEITLPDGTKQPIIGTDSFVDDTQAGILTQIFLG